MATVTWSQHGLMYIIIVRVGQYHKNGDGTVLKYYGITKYHDIIVIIIKFNY